MSSLINNFDYGADGDSQITPVIEKIIAPIIEKPVAEEPRKAEKKETGVVESAGAEKTQKVAVEKKEIDAATSNIKKQIVAIEVPLSSISAQSNQPRKSFDAASLNELAVSIQNQGLLQPLLVEEYAPGKYSIIAGERRFRAAKIANLETVPVIVKSMTELERIEVALVENIQREALNPIDEASAYYYLIQKSGLTQEEVAEKVGKKRSTISNSLRLLQLPDTMKDDVISGALTPGHARAILSLVNPSDRILLRNKILDNDLSVREAEKEAEALNQGKKLVIKKNGKGEKQPYIIEVEDKFLEAFGTKVQVKGNLKRGKLVIPYTSKAELERIYQLIDKDGELFSE